ncbi:hypothetical protein AX16_008810 [Volvariella volvacea WC 439]|nr:hypothetical protein AX16_008810 [Volvariella volvacea WC 439]
MLSEGLANRQSQRSARGDANANAAPPAVCCRRLSSRPVAFSRSKVRTSVWLAKQRTKTHTPGSRTPRSLRYHSATTCSPCVYPSSSTAPSGTSRKKRKRLDGIVELPLDLLYETFSHLELPDLLNLTRSTKALRGMLMTRSAAGVWKSAFRNTNPRPPPLPPRISWPQYTTLLYMEHCQFCGVESGVMVLWASYTRCCANCLDKEFGVPPSDDALGKTLRDLSPKLVVRVGMAEKFIWHKSDLERIRQMLIKLETAGDCAALEKFVNEQKKLKAKILKHAKMLAVWDKDFRRKRNDELQALRERRLDDITLRLVAMGWGTELRQIPADEFASLACVSKPERLTDRTWEYIGPELITFLKESRRNRLKELRTKVISQRCKLLADIVKDFKSSVPRNSVIPTLADFASEERTHQLIFKKALSATLTDAELKATRERLPEFVQTWRSACDAILLGIVPTARLDLATTFFSCSCCTDPISYPRILVHACLTRGKEQQNCVDQELVMMTEAQPWRVGAEGVRFHERAWRQAAGILTALGMDPDTTTPEQMDELDPRVECALCSSPGRRVVMRWRAAVLHAVSTHCHVDIGSKNWRVVDNERVRRLVKRQEEEDMLRRKGPDLGCMDCGDLFPRKDVKIHMAYRHHNQKARTDQFFTPLDSPIDWPPCTIFI